MMRGILQKCKNTVQNKSPDDLNVNFVCYRCNYPCFKVCAAEKCPKPEEFTDKEPIFEDSYENYVNDEPKRSPKLRKKTKEEISRKISSHSGKTEDLTITSATSKSLTDSFFNDSIPEVLKNKTSDRALPFTKLSKNTVNSRASSERMKNYIYETFPPVLVDPSVPDNDYTMEELIDRIKNAAGRNYNENSNFGGFPAEMDFKNLNQGKFVLEEIKTRGFDPGDKDNSNYVDSNFGFPAQMDFQNLNQGKFVLEKIETRGFDPGDRDNSNYVDSNLGFHAQMEFKNFNQNVILEEIETRGFDQRNRDDYVGGYINNRKNFETGLNFGGTREILDGRSSVVADKQITKIFTRSQHEDFEASESQQFQR